MHFKNKTMSKVGILITTSFTNYSIAESDNKSKEALRQTSIISGGLLEEDWLV